MPMWQRHVLALRKWCCYCGSCRDDAHTMQGYRQIPEKPRDPESRENRNMSGSQKTVLRILLTPGKQLFAASRLHCAYDGMTWPGFRTGSALILPTRVACRNLGTPAPIVTTRHHDGFCLWPSRYTEYCVKNSKNKKHSHGLQDCEILQGYIKDRISHCPKMKDYKVYITNDTKKLFYLS